MKTEELKYKLRHVSGLMDLAYFYDGQVDDPLYYDRWSGRLEKIADKLIESYAQQLAIEFGIYVKENQGKENFDFCRGDDEAWFDEWLKKQGEPEQQKCVECGSPMQKKKIIIKGDEDTCDECLCPE